MEYRKFQDTYVVRLDRGEEILTELKKLSAKEHISLASVQGLGATDDFTVGVYNTDTKVYASNHFTGPHEIVSLTGTLDTMKAEPYLHLHMSAGNQQGQVFGGHLNSARISATCELVIRCIPGTIDRAPDQETGLNLFRFL